MSMTFKKTNQAVEELHNRKLNLICGCALACTRAQSEINRALIGESQNHMREYCQPFHIFAYLTGSHPSYTSSRSVELINLQEPPHQNSMNFCVFGLFKRLFLPQFWVVANLGHEYKEWCLQEFPQVREKALF